MLRGGRADRRRVRLTGGTAVLRRRDVPAVVQSRPGGRLPRTMPGARPDHPDQQPARPVRLHDLAAGRHGRRHSRHLQPTPDGRLLRSTGPQVLLRRREGPLDGQTRNHEERHEWRRPRRSVRSADDEILRSRQGQRFGAQFQLTRRRWAARELQQRGGHARTRLRLVHLPGHFTARRRQRGR